MFGFVPLHVKDESMKYKYFTCKIMFSRFNKKFQEGQKYLDSKLLEFMQPVIPYRTGVFRSRINAANVTRIGTGKLVVTMPPQGRMLYRGISKSGKKIRYTNPLSVPNWGTAVWRQRKPEIMKGVKETIKNAR